MQESLLTIVVIPTDEGDECELFLKEFSGKFLDEWVEAYREWWPENNGKGQPPREVGFFVKKWWIFMGKRWLGEPPEEVVSPKQRIDALVKMKKRCEQRLGRRVDWNEGRTKYLTGTAGAGGIHLGGSGGGADGGDDDSDDSDSSEDGDGGEGGSALRATASERAASAAGQSGESSAAAAADDDEDDGDSEEPGFVFADERGNEGMETDEGDAPAPAEAPTKGKRKAPEPSSPEVDDFNVDQREQQRVTELLRTVWPSLPLRVVHAQGTPEWCAQIKLEVSDAFRDQWMRYRLQLYQADPQTRRFWSTRGPEDLERQYNLWFVQRWAPSMGRTFGTKETTVYVYRLRALAATACEDPSLKAAQTLEQWEREFKARVTAKDARVAERKRAQAAKKARIDAMLGALLPADTTPETVNARCEATARALGVVHISHLIDDDLGVAPPSTRGA